MSKISRQVCFRLVTLIAVTVLLFSVWTSSLAQTQSNILFENFDDDPLGALGAPWSISSAGSGSTVSIVNTSDHGHALQLRGSTAEGSYIIASRAISSSAPDITTNVYIKPGSGSSFIWSLHGAGSSIGRRRIRLQQSPGSTTLAAQTVPSGTTNCGRLQPGAWSRVTLIVHSGSFTFDVMINGTATACRGVAAGIQPPFSKISVMDASNLGWGGTVLFDNIEVTTP